MAEKKSLTKLIADAQRQHWREAQQRSRERRHAARLNARTAYLVRRRRGRTFKIYCESAQCRGHWLSLTDLERERAAGRPYAYQRMTLSSKGRTHEV